MRNAAASWAGRVRRTAAACAVAALAGAGLVLAAAAPAAADTDDFRFESLHTEFELSRDDEGAGVATVTETFVAVFPPRQNRGFIRAIPEEYRGAPLFPRVEAVTDETGAERDWEADSESGYIEITAGDPDGAYVEGRQTYVFTYTLDNVGRAMDNGFDEFYWDINGTEWLQPFDAVSAAVTVDAELAAELTGDARCYIGDEGECDIAFRDLTDGDVRIETDAVAASPEESATLAVGFEPGTFTPYDRSFAASPFGWAQAAAALGSVIALGAAVFLRRRKLRDDAGRPTIIAEYAPPAGVDAMTAASIRSTSAAVPATILELAVSGAIRIVETHDASGSSADPELSAELVDATRATGSGRRILIAMFGDELSTGEIFEFGESNDEFAKTSGEIVAEAAAAAKAAYRRPVPTGRLVAVAAAGVGLGLATMVLGAVALDAYVHLPVPIVLMFVGLLCLIATIVAVLKSPFNAAGAELRDHLKGLELFITVAEEDRIRTLQSPAGAERRPVDVNDRRAMLHLYERLLPYAVVFGKEKEWADELATRYGDEQPTWWAGSTAFQAAVLSSRVGSLSSSVMSTTTSTASSSGGSTGGGFGGGGGGGGGGRGF